MKWYHILVFLSICINENSCKKENTEPQPVGPKNFTITTIEVDGKNSGFNYPNASITPQIVFSFSDKIDHQSAQDNIIMNGTTGSVSLSITFSNGDSTLTIEPNNSLGYWNKYSIAISPKLMSVSDLEFGSPITIKLVTQIDPSDKFPTISDSVLLDLIQHQTFKYFWDYAEPNSGMARERIGSGDVVTSGGSGFGIMSIVVGIERNFITREEGVQRLDKILTFLEKADRFHGAWSHWINGSTGKVIPFSTKDNGGDLVETSFLMQGLLTFRQYLKSSDATESALIDRINVLWNDIEWDWYRKDNQNVLYWHWS
ncbi:MAG TPA: Ig-like domain-containing protein, partial [Cyclobacteriaceae bacterium]|nr:Ig-like domain-containing protein [Cyclobacteriaceae bacterium]